MDDSTDKIPSSTPEQTGGAEATGGEAKLAPQNDIPMVAPPAHKPSRRRCKSTRAIALTILLPILLLVSCVIASGYYYYTNTISKPLTTFIRPVARSTD